MKLFPAFFVERFKFFRSGKKSQVVARPGCYDVLDYNRCVLMIMFILAHIVAFGDLYPDVQYGMVIIANPAFLMITGFLVNVKKTWRKFGVYLSKIALIYAIMETGYAVMSVYFPVRYGIDDCCPATLIRVLLFEPVGPYWFFHTMIVCSLVYYVSFRITFHNRYFSLAVFAALLAIASKSAGIVDFKFALSFYIGACVRVFGGRFESFFKPSYLASIPFLVLLAVYRAPKEWTMPIVLVLAVLLVCFLSRCFIDMKECGLKKTVGYIGRNTLPIYMFHPVFTMAMKFALPFFWFDRSGLVYTVFTVAVCIAGSLALALVMDRTGLSYCFGRKSLLR